MWCQPVTRSIGATGVEGVLGGRAAISAPKPPCAGPWTITQRPVLCTDS